MLTISANYSLTPSFQAKRIQNTNLQKVVINGVTYVPKDDFHGVPLKLTPKDRQRIAELKEKIAELVIENIKLESMRNCKSFHPNIRNRYNTIYNNNLSQITDIEKEIQNIKVARHKKQTALAAKRQKN
ncbi:MAG: hypothetical protein MJ230_06615 [bacterium]|nr:hypothetical protein [bacterium]